MSAEKSLDASRENTPSEKVDLDRRRFLSGLAAAGVLAWFIGKDSIALGEDSPATKPAGDSLLGAPLHAEFAEECQILRLYAAFADKAQKEGYPHVAKLFRAVVAAEIIHADGLAFVMEAVKSTECNLKNSSDYEDTLVQIVLPKSKALAEKTNRPIDAMVIGKFIGASQTHSDIFNAALAAIKSGKDLGEVKFTVCSVCGSVFLGDGPDTCGVCATERTKFISA